MRNLATLFAALAAVVLTANTSVARAEGYRLPWPAGHAVFVTQDCNDSCCNDHVGHNEYAWDFAASEPFEVVAPRSGTVVHVKMSSNHGGEASEVDAANYIVIDHGDGTASVMLHLAYGTLDPAVRCGAFVRQGQRLALTGATGWASGNHLHYQVNRIPPGMNRTCECGPDGMGCGEYESHWDLFWSRGQSSTSVPVQFDEWRDASVCADRHDDTVLMSRNVDSRNEVVAIDDQEPGRFLPLRGNWSVAVGGGRGNYRQAAPGADAAALVSFAGRVHSPGVYEVWTGTPAAGRNVGARAAQLDVVARGARAGSVLSQSIPGGGYHALDGRFKLTGREGEGLLFAYGGRQGEALAVDGVVLRRVGDAGRATEGASCSASTECAGDLVCNGGRCAAGCEQTGCAAGSVCDATGLCASPANAVRANYRLASTPVETTAPVNPAPSATRAPQTLPSSPVVPPPAPAVPTRSIHRPTSSRSSRVHRPVGGGEVVLADAAPRKGAAVPVVALGAVGLAGAGLLGAFVRRRRARASIRRPGR